MLLHFYKFHGAGNDFILIDGRELTQDKLTYGIIEKICHRRYGIGADGLMILKKDPEFDFEMVYYNSNGREGSMCGNGGRCIVAFSKKLGIIESKTIFRAVDGVHEASIDENGLIKLKMSDVEKIEEKNHGSFLNTGSPHYVKFVDNPDLIDIYGEGKKIRYSKEFGDEGTNVNFVSRMENGIYVRTYERGVEDETYACGTGSVASAIAFYKRNTPSGNVIPVKTLVGLLEISFEEKDGLFVNIFLKGPAVFVFEGDIFV
jgi:diaminopimelate epimerase